MAAKSGRADLFFLGDSIVSYGQGGWASGVAAAAQTGIGLAGSGLLAPPSDQPDGWVNYAGARIWSGPATNSVAAGLPGLTPSGRHYVPNAGSFAFLGTGVDPVTLDLSRPIDWHVFATGFTPNAQLQATRTRRTNDPWSATTDHTTGIQIVPNDSADLQDYTFSFPAMASPGDWTTFELTSASRDSAIYYSKLTYPDASGITVSGWNFSGGTAQGFRDQYYNHSRFTSQARTELYDSLVAGNSGKLNVAITFGVNDATQIGPDQYEPAVRGLIADVRRDWLAAGRPIDDLCFTLVSSYQVNQNVYQDPAVFRLNAFRGVLDSIAAGDEQISFIDMWSAGPNWQTAIADGLLADSVHPSLSGTRVYGQTLLDQLMPALADSNLDGTVNFDDLLALSQHYGATSNVNWHQGDFNGDGAVTFDDLLLLAQEYSPSAGVDANSFAADWALARSIAPEPMSMLSAILLGGVIHRRR